MSKTVRPPMGRYGMIPSAAYIDKRLNATMRDILGVLSAHGNMKHDGWCYLFQHVIAELLGLKREVVNRHIRSLYAYGYLDKRDTYLKSGGRTYSWYRVNGNYELPAEHSRLAPPLEEEPPDEAPPCDSIITPMCAENHTPVIVESQLIEDERGNLNGETPLGDTTAPFSVKEPDGEPEPEPVSPIAWARRVEWHNGLPRLSKALAIHGVTRKAMAPLRLGRWLDEGLMPPFWAWEECHFWPKNAFNSQAEREHEYKRFATVVLAHTVDVPPSPAERSASPV